MKALALGLEVGVIVMMPQVPNAGAADLGLLSFVKPNPYRAQRARMRCAKEDTHILALSGGARDTATVLRVFPRLAGTAGWQSVTHLDTLAKEHYVSIKLSTGDCHFPDGGRPRCGLSRCGASISARHFAYL